MYIGWGGGVGWGTEVHYLTLKQGQRICSPQKVQLTFVIKVLLSILCAVVPANVATNGQIKKQNDCQ